MNIYKDHYNKDIGYEVSFSRERRVLELCGDVKSKRILDIGCADGYLGSKFKEKEANKVVGIDISENQIKEARKKLDEAISLDVQEEKIPFDDNYFDIVLITEVIEHLFNPKKVIKKIKRVLNDDGFAVITTPNFLVFSNRFKMFFGKFDYTETGVFDKGHVHFFSHSSLLNFVRENGFKVTEQNNLMHPKIPQFLSKIFPKVFVFQSIIKIRKK
ncbi:MAG: class I SAM-dependent methyltransferase [Patescibacteria group bacterium]|nr:class I SAM-dependent methyltransferase [Patescibacteria group bacterium]